MSSRAPFTHDELAAFEREWNRHPGVQHMGVHLVLTVPGHVKAIVDPVAPFHRGGLGTDAVNGPTMAGLFDLTMGLLGYLESGGRRAGVVELHVHFLRPVHGERFEVDAHPTRSGRTLVFAAAEVTDARGVVCASAESIVAIVGTEPGEPPAF